jgi:dTDP-4-amino-4,6-dideoxygalactose transaminase
MSVERLEEKLVDANKSGRLPKVVIPVHFAGQPCEMARISELAQEYGFTVIEDASHAIGAKYRGEPVGCCRYSEMTIFSFHPVKIITTGEGGMVVTNKPDTHEKLLRLRSHGITRDPALMDGESHGAWYYQQVELGYNYRMTDMQAALGSSQMTRLDEFVTKRHELAGRYARLLSDMLLTLPWQHPDGYSAFHLYVVRLHATKKRRQVFDSMRASDIGVNVHYIPVHTHPYYLRRGFAEGMFPEAERYYSQAISLPMYFAMTDEQQDRVVDSLCEALV